mmetsp:Transcript_48637/g.58667  ORF Transcript_48637/g.58667 Transcript_48637/m.58667 type:complete len:228 (-) Transcript_48637:118-801(-)
MFPSCAIVNCAAFVATSNYDYHIRACPIKIFMGIDKDDNEDSKPKPKSRLALLAEDWLDEEEDELQQYWERFDAKSPQLGTTTSRQGREEEKEASLPALTTEQQLERYYDLKGINLRKEKEYATEIQAAIRKAQTVSTPEQAIAALEVVTPYLQVNTQLGGTALIELFIALWQRDDEPNEDLCAQLLGNLHVKGRLQQLLRDDQPPKRISTDSFWGGLFNGNNIWWD